MPINSETHPPAGLMVALAVAAVVSSTTRSGGAGDAGRTPPLSVKATPLRPVRVLVARGVSAMRMRSTGGLSVDAGRDRWFTAPIGDDWLSLVRGADGSLSIDGRSVNITSLNIAPREAVGIEISLLKSDEWTDGAVFPGRLSVSVDLGGALNLTNLVDIEQYVACVVAAEAWPTFAAEALRAQAIVARSFVLYQMVRKERAEWDIAATEGSQVYRGLRDDEMGRRAAQAADATRGIVCTWNDNGREALFSTYYSSVCGGTSQSAAIFGTQDAVPPLAGQVKCDYCRIAPEGTYRWGPVRLGTDELLSRLLRRYPGLTSLGQIKRITVLESVPGGPAGRAVNLRITGTSGKDHDILAERFRLAVGPDVMRSTDCTIRVRGSEAIFEHGRGFGHGIGLCQWGAQGQALAGRRAEQILRFYYPGTRLTRVY